jgi:hypothetical protein
MNSKKLVLTVEIIWLKEKYKIECLFNRNALSANCPRIGKFLPSEAGNVQCSMLNTQLSASTHQRSLFSLSLNIEN